MDVHLHSQDVRKHGGHCIFPEVAFITNILIYYREDGAAQMDDFRLFVLNTTLSSSDEYRCYTDLYIEGLPDTTQDIDCYKLARKVFFFNRGKVVELCYIEINASNVCMKGCEPGQGGRYCTFYNTVYNGIAKQSISSPSSPANVLIDGITTSCISIVSTTSNSYIQIGNESLIVINGLYLFFGDRNPPAGIHKVYCSNTTDSWADSTVLYNAEYINENIDVFAVCKYIIYIPPILNGNAQIDICEIEIGGCFYGKYGDSCQLLCPGNCIGPCDLNTGNCLFGCFDGWIGDRCDKACDEGKFGGQCLQDCSANCLSSPCDHITGQCIAGCIKGWEGFNCTEECKKGNFGWNCLETCNGCIRNDCNHISGVCKNDNVCKPGYMHGRYCNQTCEAWQFGTNCNKTCNCLLEPCNPLTGECSDDICQIGWKGDSCDKECDHGRFGYNCKEFCDGCFNHSCNRFNGSCDTECKFGFSGPLCANKDTHTQESQAGSGAAIGGGISGVIIVIVIVVLAVIIYRRRSASPQDKNLSGNQSPRRSEGNTYFNHEIIQNKEEGYANMGSKTSVEDVHVSVTVQLPSNRRDSDENDQLPEEEEYEEEDEKDLYTNEVSRQTKYKIPISDLKNIINEKRKDEGFNNEYKILPKGLVHAHDEGSKEENKLKNRFLRTWPYDHSRIVLTGNTKHDYINASYIDSYAKERTYIASQGPKKSTLRDFWHMIWQERVGKIVMVTKLEEERRKKCEQYWPQNVNRPMLVDNYKLTMKEEIQHTVYVYRLIILYNKTNKSEREVHHFHLHNGRTMVFQISPNW
ncbi:unnamed protein product [Mytilus edulis]|uniref:protein-tyrosine-phosphatase n=1 Tax=Mytilus edulis TaxID=6550 RepID=A0A8S3UWQ8_MYTED|nr:unnamed protein product [Mytilus edulis]